MKAAVIFTSRYGNTERIAKSLARGLNESGAEAVCLETTGLEVETLPQYDLLCVGSPTEAFTAHKPMKQFLEEMKRVDLSGRSGFAFDTRLSWRLSGSAAKFIERRLSDVGLKIIASRESAIVSTVKERGSVSGATLNQGEEERFMEVGRRIGSSLLSSKEREIAA